jgi:glycosyltransferase involved in cell wall biosynthesis
LKINIAFPTKPASYGGVGTFQKNISSYFLKEGYSVSHGTIDKNKLNVILIMGGTKRLLWLLKNKIKGVPIIHRLDGKNWQHRLQNFGFLYFIKSEIRLCIIKIIRKYFSNGIIYQSKFIRDWWQSNDIVIKPSVVINNGTFSNKLNNYEKPHDVICVEGELNGKPAYSILDNIKDFKVNVLGGYDVNYNFQNNINMLGKVSKEKVHKLFKDSKIFVNLETNPPCPNSMIEALSHGLPIISINNGSASEIIGDAGILIEQENDPWQYNTPKDLSNIDKYIKHILENYDEYQSKAIERYEKKFTMEQVGKLYKNFIKSFVK